MVQISDPGRRRPARCGSRLRTNDASRWGAARCCGSPVKLRVVAEPDVPLLVFDARSSFRLNLTCAARWPCCCACRPMLAQRQTLQSVLILARCALPGGQSWV